MTILFAAGEVAPLASTGGLGDVMASLPGYVGKLGHEVAVALPGYPALLQGAEPLGVEFDIPIGTESFQATVFERLSPDGTQWLLIQNDALFARSGLYQDAAGPYADNAARFFFFSKAVVELARRLDPAPRVLHLHDWHTALVPLLVREQKLPLKTLLTLHNLQHQGSFWALDFPLTNLPSHWFSETGLEFYGQLNLLKGAILHSDALSTVSSLYRQNILHTDEGCGLQSVLRHRQSELFAVPNGVDPSLWDPSDSAEISTPFSAENPDGKNACRFALLASLGLDPSPQAPVFAMIGRLADQKGFDQLLPLLPRLLATDSRLIIVGDGDATLRRDLLVAARQHPGKLAFCNRWDPSFCKQVMAGSDAILVPSHSEPSGLTPLHALRYGTIPIAHATGGLLENLADYDPSTRKGHALMYWADSSAALWDCIQRAGQLFASPSEWSTLMQSAMRARFPWEAAAARYDAIYRRIASHA